MLPSGGGIGYTVERRALLERDQQSTGSTLAAVAMQVGTTRNSLSGCRAEQGIIGSLV